MSTTTSQLQRIRALLLHGKDNDDDYDKEFNYENIYDDYKEDDIYDGGDDDDDRVGTTTDATTFQKQKQQQQQLGQQQQEQEQEQPKARPTQQPEIDTLSDEQQVSSMEELFLLDPRNNDALLQYSIDSFLSGEYDRPYAEDAPAPLPNLSPAATIEVALQSLRPIDDPEPSHGAAVLMRFCAPLSRGERWGTSTTSTTSSTSTNNDDHSSSSSRSSTKSRSSTGPSSSSSAVQSSSSLSSSSSSWKEIMRGSLTPHMLARRLRASHEFGILLDWNHMDILIDDHHDEDDINKEEDGNDDNPLSSSSSFTVSRDNLYPGTSTVDVAFRYGNRNSSNGVTTSSPSRSPSTATRRKIMNDADVVIRFRMIHLNGVWLIQTADIVSDKRMR